MSNCARSIKIFVIAAFMIFMLSACSSNTVEFTEEQDFFVAQSGINIYYFQKDYMTQDEAKEFIRLNEQAVEEAAKLLKMETIPTLYFYIGPDYDSGLNGSLVELSGVREQTADYGYYALLSLANRSSAPRWMVYGFAQNYLGQLTQWEIETASQPDAAELKEAIDMDNTSVLLQLHNANFSNEYVFYDETLRLASHQMAYLKDRFGLELMVDVLWSYDYFDTLLGVSPAEAKSDWLTQLGVSHRLENDNLFWVTAAEDVSLWSEGYTRQISTQKQTYYFSNSYLDDEDALDFVAANLQGITAVNTYLQGAGAQFAQESLTYYLQDSGNTAVDGSTIWLGGVAEGESLYISSYFEAAAGESYTSWLSYGVKGLLEQRYSGHSTSASTPNHSAAELLADETSRQLMMLDRESFNSNAADTQTFAAAIAEYVEEQYGSDVLMRLYKDDYDFAGITGTSFAELCVDWAKTQGADIAYLYEGNTANASFVLPDLSEEEAAAYFTEISGKYFYETSSALYYFEMGYLSYSDMWNFVAMLEEGIYQIKEYLTPGFTAYSGRIEYNIISGEGASYASEDGKITLRYVDQKFAEYIHETVHVLQGFYNPLWLSEGAATYIDYKFNIWASPPIYNQDLDRLAKKIIFEEGYTNLLTFSDEIFNIATEAEGRMRIYTICASLCQYVENNYGRYAFLDLYRNFQDIENILGVPFETLKSNWLYYIENL